MHRRESFCVPAARRVVQHSSSPRRLAAYRRRELSRILTSGVQVVEKVSVHRDRPAAPARELQHRVEARGTRLAAVARDDGFVV